jgi:hypothetical protein
MNIAFQETPGSWLLGDRRGTRQRGRKLACFSNRTRNINAAVVLIHDAAGEREPKACAGALSSVERAKNIRPGWIPPPVSD